MSTLYNIYQNTWLLYLTLFSIIIWSLIWKGVALWSSAKNKQKGWFFFLLILNTAGFLPIIYLIWGRKKELNNTDNNQEQIEKDSV